MSNDYLYQLIDEYEAATFLGVSHRSLQAWRVRGGGPEYVRISARAIRYRKADLIKWSESKMHSNTLSY